MQTTQCESQSELLFQSVGLSNGWITTQLSDTGHGALGHAIRWAKQKFAEMESSFYIEPLNTPENTLRAIDACRQQSIQLFMSEGIDVRFANPTMQAIQSVLRLKRHDRLANSLPFDAIQPNTSSLHLLEILRIANPKRTRGMTLADLMHLAINSGSSITDFYPDSHVLISNLASFLIRFHKQPDCKLQMETSGKPSISNKYPSLRDTWDATRSMFPRVSQRGIRNLTNQQLQRHSVMLLYGLFVLQFGHADPQPPLSLDDVQHRVRLLFDRGIAAWPKQLSDLLNSLWAQDLYQEATLAHYAEEIASTARRVGKCLLGQYPLVSELLG